MTLAVALLGAESTGKTRLAQALAVQLQAQGLLVRVVPEVLREWCDAQGRTPKAHEQLGIAHTQAQRMHTALASQADWVIADTTPLMTAIYSELIFQDRSLHDFALHHHRVYQHTLLTGLDLPWIADGIQRDGPGVQPTVDARVRHALAQAGIAFKVVYGAGGLRVHNAMRALNLATKATSIAINSIANYGVNTAENSQKTPQIASRHNAETWVWTCDKCSDPACEHRLFTDRLRRSP